jgi:hypothetical protein
MLTFADNTKNNVMEVSSMNQSQMMILESFAGAQDEQEVNDLMEVLRKFYADRLQAEMQRLWDNGTLNQKALDELKGQHFRTPYVK